MSRNLVLEINGRWSCNFNCPTCFTKVDKPTDPTLIEREKKINYYDIEPVLKDFYQSYPDGSLIIQGGEPLLNFDKFISISKGVRRNFPNLYFGTISNCSPLQKEGKLETFISSGVNYLICSLNSHIPEVHNLSRGLEKDDPNCEFILSLPSKLKGISTTVNVVPNQYNVDHLRDFVKKTYDLGFSRLSLCFTRFLDEKERISRSELYKIIGFYTWLLGLTGDLKKYIYNTDEVLGGVIGWYLDKRLPERECTAPNKTIIYTYDRKILPCQGIFFHNYSCTPHLLYSPGDISNKESKYNKMLPSVENCCRHECMLDSCYI